MSFELVFTHLEDERVYNYEERGLPRRRAIYFNLLCVYNNQLIIIGKKNRKK
jgi:hypothetical protein